MTCGEEVSYRGDARRREPRAGVGNEPSRSLRGSGVVARLLRSELSAEHLSLSRVDPRARARSVNGIRGLAPFRCWSLCYVLALFTPWRCSWRGLASTLSPQRCLHPSPADAGTPVGYRNSGRGLIFMDETAQRVPPVNFRRPRVIDRWPWVPDRRPKVKPAMRPRLVVPA